VESAEEARRQKEQLQRYLAWVEKEGGVDGPTHLSTLFRPEQQDRIAWLKEHSEGSVLELGCCYGFILAACDGQVGVDINPQNIALARVLNPRKVFLEGDIRQLPLQDNFADTVMVPECLEHLPWEDVPRALSEALRVARKKVLLTMPNAEYATKTSATFKHAWLLTQERFQALLNLLEGHQVRFERNYFWVLIEVYKT
jgi:ubiquinone/menaquinone biosynthesis C-methylase UbiE